jgi:general stress protein CsbA
MRYFKLVPAVLIGFVSYVSMMVQFMLLLENSISKSELIKREIILLLVFAMVAAIVIRYRKEEARKKERNCA